MHKAIKLMFSKLDALSVFVTLTFIYGTLRFTLWSALRCLACMYDLSEVNTQINT